jgi:hypothetical protein
MCNARSFLQLPCPEPGVDNVDGKVHYNRCMADCSTLSVLNEKLAFRTNYANGAMGRANEYLRGIMVGLDQLKVVHKYSGSPLRMQ